MNQRLKEYLSELSDPSYAFGFEEPVGIGSRNFGGDSPIHYAAINGRAEIVSLLIEAGADINALGEDGYTPLDYAILHKQEEVSRVLLSVGAKVNMQEPHNNSLKADVPIGPRP